MKILKLLSRKNLSIFIISIFIFSNNLNAEEEPADIWNIEKKAEESSSNSIVDDDHSLENNNETEKKELNSEINIIDSNKLEDNKINIVGLYDPEENGLDINMWFNSDGNEIKLILNKLKKKNLSKDAKDILDIVLLTNSYFPKENITEEDFINF